MRRTVLTILSGVLAGILITATWNRVGQSEASPPVGYMSCIGKTGPQEDMCNLIAGVYELKDAAEELKREMSSLKSQVWSLQMAMSGVQANPRR